jgi:HKD family nuclease
MGERSASAQRMVWGGSHNLTGDALLINDELLTRVDGSTSVYNAYLSHFNTAWNNPSMTFISGGD